ncbi:MAG: Sec-independent protein translocase protein TatB [Oligoflexus sp.]
MFGIGPMELAVIAIVAIVFVGPKKLPEVMRKMGKMFVQIRRQTQDIRESMSDVMRDAERELELDRIRELKEKMNKLNPQEMLKSAVKGDDVKGSDKADDPDYHESHYVDGEYKNPDDGFLDARLLEDNGWKYLRPQENAEAASEQEAGKPDGEKPAPTSGHSPSTEPANTDTQAKSDNPEEPKKS